MRFDNECASAWAERFDASRDEGTDGEGRAAEVMAEEFTRIGLRAETRVVYGSKFPQGVLPVLGWCGLGLGMTLAAFLSDRGASGVLRATAWIGAVLGWGVATLPGLRFGHGWPPRVASRNVLAERTTDGSPPRTISSSSKALTSPPLPPGEGARRAGEGPSLRQANRPGSPPARVVFRTPLDGVVLRGPEVPPWASSVTIGVLVVTLFLSSRGGVIDDRGWALPVLGFLWILVLVRLFAYLKSARDPGLRDNRTGLAVLLELGRTWPRRTDARIEAHFVAVGGQGLDGAGSRALEATMRSEWPDMPTLLIDLSAPGVGKGLILTARGHEDLTASAAADLWIPHRPARRYVWTSWARPVLRLDDDVVWLVGDEASARPDRGPAMAIDPEALGRAAQLATEIALRWARRVAEASAGSR